MTLDEAKAAWERGRHLVLVTPPAVEQAEQLWEFITPGHGPGVGSPVTPGHGPGVNPPVLIICADEVCAAEWAAAAPAHVRIHAVTGLARTTRILKERTVAVLAGAVKDVAALVARAALKLEAVPIVVIAWPEILAGGEHAAALDALLGEAHEARRVVLTWNPAALGDFLERHARRALVVGSDAAPGPLGPARYALVPAARRPAAARAVLDALDPRRPFLWDGGPVEPPAAPPDAVLCARLPTREQFAALSRLGEPIVFATAAQLPYLRSLAAPLAPLDLPSAADRARDRAETLHEQVAQLLVDGGVDAELALLGPLFERFDPAEVAAALLALRRQTSALTPSRQPSAVSPPPSAPAWAKVFVNVGKKNGAAAKDLVGALIREVGIEKGQIGRVDVRETFTLVEVAPVVAERVVRGLTGVAIKGRRAQARLDRQV